MLTALRIASAMACVECGAVDKEAGIMGGRRSLLPGENPKIGRAHSLFFTEMRDTIIPVG